jgi:hypothetical protein
MRRHLTNEEIIELLKLGFLQYAPAGYSGDDLKREAADYGLADWLGCARVYYLDAENLAEGGADHALKEMEAALAANGVAIGEPKVTYDEIRDVTVLEVNGNAKVLCKFPIPAHSSWEVFSRGFFSVVNELLSATGSSERLYVCRPYANDQTGVLLTLPLYMKLRELDLASNLVLLSEPTSAPTGTAQKRAAL